MTESALQSSPAADMSDFAKRRADFRRLFQKMKGALTEKNIEKVFSWIGFLTVLAGVLWLFEWALDHAPWAVWTVFGALGVFCAGWGLVKLAENILEWRHRVRREAEILAEIALPNPVRLSFVRHEIESLSRGAQRRREARFNGACAALMPFAAWTLYRAVVVFFFSDLIFPIQGLIEVVWIAMPVCGLVCSAIVAVTNLPPRRKQS